MVIKQLSDRVINKIAAGEVVVRPANAIKELLENSLDAGATVISIEIEESGLKKIKITDNGKGMDRDDLMLSCKRHATSKIEHEEDLFEINSLGFRGEALASIAEIAHVTIKSKTEEYDAGNKLEIEGGIVLKNEKIGCPDGTIIEIQNLFYNVPARKNFLKSPEVELAHIIDIVTRYALIRKDVAITLTHNGKEIINSQKTTDDLNNVIFIYGTEVAKDLAKINYDQQGVKITGFISKPNLTKANKGEQSLYINGRYIKSTVLTNAIYEGYKTMLFTNRHPLFILNIEMDPSGVDVNIHPNKLDVKLEKEADIENHLITAVRMTLEKETLIRQVTAEPETLRKSVQTYEVQTEKQENLFSEEPKVTSQKVEKEFEETITKITETKHVEDKHTVREASVMYEPEPQEMITREQKFSDFFVLGQVNKTFIVAENRDGLILIDQHAAEERVNYEKFLLQLKDGAIKKQTMIEKKILELTPMQFQVAMNSKDILDKLGFEFEEFGGTSITLRTIPQIFDRLKPDLFTDIINEASKVNSGMIEQEIEDRIIRFACKASIKSGDEMTISSMNDLIKKLGSTNNPYSCPHGRPTIIQITNADLEKKFKRTGW